MGNKRTPGDTCIIEGCTEPRYMTGSRRLICQKHVNERNRLARHIKRAAEHEPRIPVHDAYAYWGKGADVGRLYHEGQRIIGLRLVGTYFIATFDSLTSAPLASDAVLRIG